MVDGYLGSWPGAGEAGGKGLKLFPPRWKVSCTVVAFRAKKEEALQALRVQRTPLICVNDREEDTLRRSTFVKASTAAMRSICGRLDNSACLPDLVCFSV